MIKIKRVYEPYEKEDGYIVLVDRLWPRGLKKEEVKIDLWLKDIAPSDKLRKWFGHREDRWEEFRRLYKKELKNKKGLINRIKDLEMEHGTITLVFSAKNINYNNALILLEVLSEKKTTSSNTG